MKLSSFSMLLEARSKNSIFFHNFEILSDSTCWREGRIWKL